MTGDSLDDACWALAAVAKPTPIATPRALETNALLNEMVCFAILFSTLTFNSNLSSAVHATWQMKYFSNSGRTILLLAINAP